MGPMPVGENRLCCSTGASSVASSIHFRLWRIAAKERPSTRPQVASGIEGIAIIVKTVEFRHDAVMSARPQGSQASRLERGP
jgi:hypothetical protein